MTDTPTEQRINELLAEVYTPTGVRIWLTSRNRNLDRRRPADMIALGEADRVLAEAERVAGGAW